VIKITPAGRTLAAGLGVISRPLDSQGHFARLDNAAPFVAQARRLRYRIAHVYAARFTKQNEALH